MCAAAVAATFAAPVVAAIADAVAAATADAVKDVTSGVRTAGVNSLDAPGVISGVRTAGVNSLAAPAPGCAEGVTTEGEFSQAFSAAPDEGVNGVGRRKPTIIRPPKRFALSSYRNSSFISI